MNHNYNKHTCFKVLFDCFILPFLGLINTDVNKEIKKAREVVLDDALNEPENVFVTIFYPKYGNQSTLLLFLLNGKVQ